MNRPDPYTLRERKQQCPDSGWRRELYIIIFEADTRMGKIFDVCLLVAILTGIAVISLETVSGLDEYTNEFRSFEWFITALFSAEYMMRMLCVRKPLRYAFSFWGVIDLVSFLPSYIVLLGGADVATFGMVRAIRLLRVFRVLKLLRLMSEADELYRCIRDSRDKIVVFLFTIIIAVTLSGSLMYQVENWSGTDSSFSSIPQSMYWAIVTMTTVGYGDVVPKTAAGKAISAVLILLGYSLIIVPTGFVTAKFSQLELSRTEDGTITNRPNPPKHRERPDHGEPPTHRDCHSCGRRSHPDDAKYCNQCGAQLVSN